uniref:WD repeat-containing protein 55 homolog n=1 Tax=Anopheles dirus TaxID=7168 RepID=A0A182NSZ3_9DIPT
MALLPPDPVFCLRSPETSSYHSLCFRTPEHLYAGTAKGTVQLFDLQTNRTSYQLSVGSSPILNLAHTSDDTLITQEKEGTVKLWSLADADYVLRHEISTEHVGFCRLVLDAQSNTVIIPRAGATISVLCAKTLSEMIRFAPTAEDEKRLPFGKVMCCQPIEIYSQGYLLVGYESGAIALWDYRTGRPVETTALFMTTEADCLQTLDYDPVTNRGVCGGSSCKLSVFSIDPKTHQIAVKRELAIKNAGVHRVRIRKDLKVFVSAGWDGRLRIFSWKSLRPLAVLTEHKAEVLDVTYSDGKVAMWNAPVMAAAGSDGQISLWDLYK